MDLTARLLRAGARRPHLLLVPTVGGTEVRVAVEAEAARRGWPLATSPADADLLVVAGSAGPALTRVVENVWEQLPAPRARAVILDTLRAPQILDAAGVHLSDLAGQRATAADGARAVPAEQGDVAALDGSAGVAQANGSNGKAGHAGHEMHGGGEHAGHDMRGGDEHAGHDMRGGDEHAGHDMHGGRHGHHGGGMELPGGLAMADLGEDRDGLTLDRLHVTLGPALPDWPAGLVLRVTLQGDVIQEAAAEVLDAGQGTTFWGEPGRGPARELDGLARLLGVAGWVDAAARARRLRDELLAGVSADRVAAPVEGLLLRVGRSRTLRWSLRGTSAGPVDLDSVLGQRLAAARAALTGRAASPVVRPGPEELPGLLIGAELAAARLIVAALDPDTEAASVGSGARHG